MRLILNTGDIMCSLIRAKLPGFPLKTGKNVKNAINSFYRRELKKKQMSI